MDRRKWISARLRRMYSGAAIEVLSVEGERLGTCNLGRGGCPAANRLQDSFKGLGHRGTLEVGLGHEGVLGL